jgi:hypothetical protein
MSCSIGLETGHHPVDVCGESAAWIVLECIGRVSDRNGKRSCAFSIKAETLVYDADTIYLFPQAGEKVRRCSCIATFLLTKRSLAPQAMEVYERLIREDEMTAPELVISGT